MSESETGRETILAVGAACGEPVRKALLELLDIFEGQVKRAYAHELAEKIRYHTGRIAQTRNSAELALVMETQRELADLIDPEKENAR